MPYKVETNAKNKWTKYVIIRQDNVSINGKLYWFRVEKWGIKNCEAGNEKVENGKKNSMSTKFSQYFHKKIISDRLLHIVIGEQKSNFNGRFKLELIIIYQIWFVVKYC